MFKTKINPYSVCDKVQFQNVDKTLVLTVKADASVLVSQLMRSQAKLSEVNEGATEEEQKQAALMFAEGIFGKEQAEKLFEFYGEPLAVISSCGMYFEKRLKKLITKAQKKG